MALSRNYLCKFRDGIGCTICTICTICKEIGVFPDCNAYWDWCEDFQNRNYLYMQYSVFTHLHTLMMLHADINKFWY